MKMVDLNCGLGRISVIWRLFIARGLSSGCGVLFLWASCECMAVLHPAHKVGAFGWIAYELRRMKCKLFQSRAAVSAKSGIEGPDEAWRYFSRLNRMRAADEIVETSNGGNIRFRPVSKPDGDRHEM